jgi:hypothetical protein
MATKTKKTAAKKANPKKDKRVDPKRAKAEVAKTPEPVQAPVEKLSQIAAAERVLADAGKPMTCGEMIEAMTAKGLWSSPAGKTPAATLYASILREIAAKGKDARFVKTARGLFAVNA